MKVVLINTFYNQESTGKLMHNFRMFLEDLGHEVLMLYGHGNHKDDDRLIRLSSDAEGKLHNALGRLSGMNGCFSPLATTKAMNLIQSFQPDLVYLGNLHGHYINIYALYDGLRKLRIPIVQIMWDEYALTGACAFSYDCTRYLGICHDCPRKKDYPISLFFDTSTALQKKKQEAYQGQTISFIGVPYTASKARQSSLLRGYPVYEADEAVDQETIFYPRDPSLIKAELGIRPDQKMILNVCPYPSYRKGGSYYLELAENCLDLSDIVFVHVGFKADPSICPGNFIPIGYISDQNRLARFYSAADLFLCTSLAETQPNTCIEALSCGTPICGFDISGVPTCADAPYGHYVKPGDVAALKEYVQSAAPKTKESVETIRNYAVSRFASHIYNKKLLEAGEKTILAAKQH